MGPYHSRIASLFAELRRRRVFRTAAVYGAAAWVVIEASATIFPALHLPDWTVTLVVVVALIGFPCALIVAWALEITPAGVRRTLPLEPGAEVPRREASLAGRLAAVLLVVGLAAVGGYLAGRRIGAPSAAAGDRLGLAVFPFRPAGGADVEDWSEGVADLLATVLDGTQGLHVADPWSLWRSLRPERAARAESPDPVEAGQLARGAGAGHFILGSVVGTGEGFDLSVRVYSVDELEPIHTFAERGTADLLSEVVQRLAVEVITRVWPREELPSVPDLDRYATHSADALKAYLDAKAAMRRGLVDSADVAIDRALAIDSAFALALVEAAFIKSWAQYMRGQFFAGLQQLAERAEQQSDSLSERNRLRVESTLASIRTDGVVAAEAARRIVEIDSTDFGGWNSLAYYNMVYGWQYGADEGEALAAAERVVQLDSSYVPGLALRAWLAAAFENEDDMRRQLALLRGADTTSTLARATISSLRALLVSDEAFAAFADTIAAAPVAEWYEPIRYLRNLRPTRAELLVERLASVAGPGWPRMVVATTQARLAMAQGRLAELDSAVEAGAYELGGLDMNIRRALAGVAIAGVAAPELGAAPVMSLAAYVPVDSALAYLGARPVWPVGWAVAAYHAMFGDTTVTHRWHETIGSLPPGGMPTDYRGGLQNDLEARLAVRRGDLEGALAHAETAFELWGIHTPNDWEGMPEPAMRLHLALLQRAVGRPDRAEALLRSLVPPTTWMGFLTVRSSFELGELAEERGDRAAAARYYRNALKYWARGGPEVADWRERAEAGLRRVVAERAM